MNINNKWWVGFGGALLVVLANPGFAGDYILIPERPSDHYVDATATHLPVEPSLHATDSVLVDVDSDGDLDAVVSVEYGVNRLYVNQGEGHFIQTVGAFGTEIHDNEHVRAADFNQDGFMDVVFVAESDETHQLFLGDGKGSFKKANQRLPAMSQGNALAIGDLNGDRLPDIFIGSTGELGHGKNAKTVPAKDLLFFSDHKKPGFFIDVSATHLPQGDHQTEGVALADMNNDGALDIVKASPSKPNSLLINNGSGVFSDESHRLELLVPMETREVHVADVNQDGYKDIIYFNITSNNAGWEKDPQTRLLINDGKGHFKDETKHRLPKHRFSSWAGKVIDFNSDGAPDLLVGAIQVPGFVPLQLQAWENNGEGVFTDVTAQVVPGITVGRSWSMGTGDVDGDGKADVLVGGWGTQARLLLTDIKGYYKTLPSIPRLTPGSKVRADTN